MREADSPAEPAATPSGRLRVWGPRAASARALLPGPLPSFVPTHSHTSQLRPRGHRRLSAVGVRVQGCSLGLRGPTVRLLRGTDTWSLPSWHHPGAVLGGRCCGGRGWGGRGPGGWRQLTGSCRVWRERCQGSEGRAGQVGPGWWVRCGWGALPWSIRNSGPTQAVGAQPGGCGGGQVRGQWPSEALGKG